MAPKNHSKKIQEGNLLKISSDPEINRILEQSDLSPANAKIVAMLFEFFERKIAQKDAIINETLNEIKIMKTNVQRIDKMEKKIDELENTVEILKSKIDTNEQYERLDTLIMSGAIPEVRPDEDCKSVIHNVLRERNLAINTSDISIAHRIGKKATSGRDNRNIIFKFDFCRPN